MSSGPRPAPSTISKRCGRAAWGVAAQADARRYLAHILRRACRCRMRCERIMRLMIAAIGRLKAGAERELAERYRDRVAKAGRAVGLRDVEIVEIRESRAAEAPRRKLEESIALANIIPEGAVVVALDEAGDNLASGAIAGAMRSW